MGKMAELWELIDHVETEHEREVLHPYTFTRLRAMHKDMHQRGDHWDHNHTETEIRFHYGVTETNPVGDLFPSYTTEEYNAL